MAAVSSDYLAKVRFAVRRNSDELLDSELTDIILQCRADLIRIGVIEAVANSETDYMVLGCQRCFARWQSGSGDNPDKDKEDYINLANDLRKSIGYGYKAEA